MKARLYIFFISLFAFTGINGNELLTKAEKAYDSRNYRTAIENYEKLVNQGFKSYQLYYNLGNAYYRDNQLGKAIYFYELARKAEPNDEDTRINLGIASSKTIDRIDARENFFISAVKTNILTSMSTRSWAWLSIAVLLTGCILFFVYISTSRYQLKRSAFTLSMLFFLAFICFYLLGYSAVRSRNENKFAIIVSKEVKIMNEPTGFAKPKFTLHEGTKVRVVEDNGDWLLIKLDNGNEGWLKVFDVGVI